MNCPHCNTPNDPTNQFCVSCGKSIHVGPASGPSGKAAALSVQEFLGMLTLRLVMALLGLWILRAVIVGLSFVEQFKIPDFNVSTVVLINAFVYLLMIILLLNYARDLGGLWQQAFSGYPGFGSLLVALIYVLVLAAVYNGARSILVGLIPDPEVLMVVQITLIVLVLLILARVAIQAYQGLAPWISRWITNLRQAEPPAK